MNLVFLDAFTANPGDLSWSAFESLGTCTVHDRTPVDQIVERARDAEIVITNKAVLSRAVIEALPKLRYIGVIATGYNGAPRGEENCCDVGSCWRDRHNIPHGEQYEKCVAVHAEANAIISASRNEMIGSTLFLSGFEGFDHPIENPTPCVMCTRLIKNAGIERVVNHLGEVTI